MLYVFKPYGFDGNLGQAYNSHISLVPNDEDWCLLLDGDCQFLTFNWGEQIERIIKKYPNVDLFTCYTNRVGNISQLYNQELSMNDSIIYHREIAEKISREKRNKIKFLNSPISGHFMLFQKKLWNEIKFSDGLLGIDNKFSQSVLNQNKRIALIEEIYIFHYYRLKEGKFFKNHLLYAQRDNSKPRVLVSIANYNLHQLQYLKEIVREYKSYKNFNVDIVIYSNINIQTNKAEVKVVELSDWQTLPFKCREVLFEKRNQYDIFIYTENDHLITEKNLTHHLQLSKELPSNKIPGFFQYEAHRDFHSYPAYQKDHWGWNKEKTFALNGKVFAQYQNVHQGCFILTKEQFDFVLKEINFLSHNIPPNFKRHTKKIHATTDIYELCKWEKCLDLTNFDLIKINHLPNKYPFLNEEILAQDINQIKENVKEVFDNDLTFICATNNENILKENLFRSECIKEESLILKKGYQNVSKAYNEAFLEANTPYLIYLHQDVFLPKDFIKQIKIAISQLNYLDPNWGVIGVAGAKLVEKEKKLIGHVYSINYEWGHYISTPQIVDTLDELLFIVKKEDKIKFEERLKNHFYAADICLQMKKQNRLNYAVEAYCYHNSTPRPQNYQYPKDFWFSRNIISSKYKNLLPIVTTSTQINE